MNEVETGDCAYLAVSVRLKCGQPAPPGPMAHRTTAGNDFVVEGWGE